MNRDKRQCKFSLFHHILYWIVSFRLIFDAFFSWRLYFTSIVEQGNRDRKSVEPRSTIRMAIYRRGLRAKL